MGKDGENPCKTLTRFEKPLAAVNSEGRMTFILNDVNSARYLVFGIRKGIWYLGRVMFILNNVNSARAEGRLHQTVQTGTCEKKGDTCGGGGIWCSVFGMRYTVVEVVFSTGALKQCLLSFYFRFRVLLPTRVYIAQAGGSQGVYENGQTKNITCAYNESKP